MDCWVPELIEYDSSSEWKEYEAALYEIFKRDFLESKPVFNGLPVSVRTDPRFDGKEEGFWHVTCRDYSHKDGTPESRDPDMERCRRIKWPRAFIENYGLCERDTDPEFVCDGTIRNPSPASRRVKSARIALISSQRRFRYARSLNAASPRIWVTMSRL